MERRKDYERRFKKAKETEKAAKLFAKYKLTKMGYHCVTLESKKGFESAGIVDAIAVRKLFKDNADAVEIVLLQIKGNVAVPQTELQRLRKATERVKIRYGTAEYKQGKLANIEIYGH